MEQGQETSVVDNEKQKIEFDIKSSPIKAKWETNIPDKAYGVVLSLPHNCFISATLNINPESRDVYIDFFQVNEKVQKQGIGTRLLKALVVESKQYGATSLSGHVTSESALKTRAKVFGPENLEFFDKQTHLPLEINFEEALRRSAELGSVDYGIKVDLTKIKTDDWKKPIPHD